MSATSSGQTSIPSRLISAGRTVKDFLRIARGYVPYLLRAQNDERAFRALRRSFCATGGRTNDALAFLHRLLHKPYALDAQPSVVPGLDPAGVARVVQHLDQDGYHNFGAVIPDPLCQELVDFALRTPCGVIRDDATTFDMPEERVFDPQCPVGVAYHARFQDIVEQPAAQRLVADPGLLAIAQGYFRAKAVQDLVALWWSAPGTKPSHIAAQLYHFDMDRVKFLKFFVYLTDVGEENGPHCFVAGTHRRVPKPLRAERRFTDEEVFACVPRDREIVFKGPRGTLIVEDTRGLHKGTNLIRGNRLVFQIEFAINLFGAEYPPIRLNERFSQEFRDRVRRYPYTFANYVEPTAAGANGTGKQGTHR